MTTPCSGAISMANVNTELGTSGIITLNDSDVRELAGKPSGIIKLSDLYCKSKTVDGWINALDPLPAGSGQFINMTMTNHGGHPNFNTPETFPQEDDILHRLFDNNNGTNVHGIGSLNRFTRGGAGRKVVCGTTAYVTRVKLYIRFYYENHATYAQAFNFTANIGLGVAPTQVFQLNHQVGSSGAVFIEKVYSKTSEPQGTLNAGSGQGVTVSFTKTLASPFVIGHAGDTRYLAMSFEVSSGSSTVVSVTNPLTIAYGWDFEVEGVVV